MKTTSKYFLISFVAILLLSSCYPKRTPFEGSVSLPIAPSAFKTIMTTIADFENKYPKARINGSRQYCRASVDSLLNNHTEQIVIDRPLTKPESLAFKSKKKNIYVFRLARIPMSLVVNLSNPISDFDSLEIADILTGKKTQWNQLGDFDEQPIRLYLPRQGEGVWELIQVLFNTPSQIIANVVDSDSVELFVSQDVYAIGAIAGIASESVRSVGVRFQGKLQKPTLRAVYEQRYPWVLPIVYVTTKDKIDVGTSFLNHISSREGQKLLSDLNTLPAMVPIKVTN